MRCLCPVVGSVWCHQYTHSKWWGPEDATPRCGLPTLERELNLSHIESSVTKGLETSDKMQDYTKLFWMLCKYCGLSSAQGHEWKVSLPRLSVEALGDPGMSSLSVSAFVWREAPSQSVVLCGKGHRQNVNFRSFSRLRIFYDFFWLVTGILGALLVSKK